MTERPPQRSRELLFVGLFAVAMGVMAMLFVTGLLPSKGTAPAPTWIGALAGFIFVLAGGALMLRWFAGGDTHDGELPKDAPMWILAVYYLVGLMVIGALATIASWVAFGPGERGFTMSAPYLSRGPANEWLGRSLFGAGALLVWLFFFVAAASWGRKLRRRSI
jgi:hypothetical protein